MSTPTATHAPEFAQLCADAKTRINEISLDETLAMQQRGEPFYLIDVRETVEFDKGALPHALPLSKGLIEVKIHRLVDDKAAKVVLYCGGGNRSALAADNLQKMGYSNVHSMIGGYRGYMAHLDT